MLDREETIKALERFKKHVITQSKRNLTSKDKNVRKTLWNSIGGEIFIGKSNRSIGLYFQMEEYGQFQDLGVKGRTSSSKAPNSPFKFGKSYGKKDGSLTEAIEKWVKDRRLQFRNRETGNLGKFLSYKSTAHLITRSIYNKGLKPSYFFTKPFEAAFKNLPEELVEKYKLDLEQLLKSSINA